MIGGGGIGSVGGQSSSTDESDSTVSLANQVEPIDSCRREEL